MPANFDTNPMSPRIQEYTNTVQDRSPEYIQQGIGSLGKVSNAVQNFEIMAQIGGSGEGKNATHDEAKGELSRGYQLASKEQLVNEDWHSKFLNRVVVNNMSGLGRGASKKFEQDIREFSKRERRRSIDLKDISEDSRSGKIANQGINLSIDMAVANDSNLEGLQKGLKNSKSLYDETNLKASGINREVFEKRLGSAGSNPNTLRLLMAKSYEKTGLTTGVRTFSPEVNKIMRGGAIPDSYRKVFKGLSDKEIRGEVRGMASEVRASASIYKPLGVSEEVRLAKMNRLDKDYYPVEAYAQTALTGVGNNLNKEQAIIAETDRNRDKAIISKYTNVSVGDKPVNLRNVAPTTDAQGMAVITQLSKSKLIQNIKPMAFEQKLKVLSNAYKQIADMRIVEANIKSRRMSGIGADPEVIMKIHNEEFEKVLFDSIDQTYEDLIYKTRKNKTIDKLREEQRLVKSSIILD